MKENRREYPAVDCFKFICCILIVAIHAKPFEQNFWLDAGVGLLTRFAVPYFFIASGFFFFSSISNKTIKNECLIKYEIRMLKLYVIWFIIQNIQSILRGYVYSPIYYIKQFILPTNGSALWFLPATMIAVLLAYGLSRIFNSKTVFSFSVLIWLLGYCLSTIKPLFTGSLVFCNFAQGVQSFIGIQNGLFFGLPYIAMSNMLADKELELKRNVQRDILGVVISFVCLSLESLIVVMKLHPSLTFLWISALPMTYFMFHLTLTIEFPQKACFTVMRKISTLVYVIHPIVINVFKDLLEKFDYCDIQNIVLFVGTCFISILISLFLHKCSEKKLYKILKLHM